ncbi:hypothetical protein ACEPAI_2742 [Sanghuangporus weigelae]
MGRTKSSTPSDSFPLSDTTDPLSRLLAPPPDESPEARAARQKREADAKKRSDEIDARLAAESAARRKKGAPIKILLLGQSESGKSTTLKNFQLTYARKQWLAEKEAWRAVIQLNLVRSVNAIASAVARELPSSNAGELEHEHDNAMDAETASILTLPEVEAEVEQQDTEETSKFPLTDEHRSLLLRLTPLKAVQRTLEMKLGSGAEEIGYNDNGEAESENANVDPSDPARKPSHPNSRSSAGSNANTVSFRDITNAASTPSSSAPLPLPPPQPSLRTRKSHQEFFVRSYGWKSALQRLRPRGSRSGSGKDELGAGDGDDPDGVAIARAAGDMKALWRDKLVREVIRVRKIRLMDCAEFFLNDIDRVCAQRYVPSDDDIIRARLRTVGVQEHTLTLESNATTDSSSNRTWIIYDVGGSRTQRAQWPAYFDDVHAIIFLAPLSAFDERLAEAPRVNRLDDSMQLWKLVCANKLLARAELVLFLNKVDLLERKLAAAGVRFGEYVRSYRDGENEVGAVGKFLRGKFMEVCRHYSKEHRGLHVHFTSVIDTQATAKTLAAVQDGILRSNLRHLDLI